MFVTPSRKAQGSVDNSPELMAAAERRLAEASESIRELAVRDLAALLWHLQASEFAPPVEVFRVVEEILMGLACNAEAATARSSDG